MRTLEARHPGTQPEKLLHPVALTPPVEHVRNVLRLDMVHKALGIVPVMWLLETSSEAKEGLHPSVRDPNRIGEMQYVTYKEAITRGIGPVILLSFNPR